MKACKFRHLRTDLFTGLLHRSDFSVLDRYGGAGGVVTVNMAASEGTDASRGGGSDETRSRY